MATPPVTAVARLTPIQWVICAVAALGFAFDTYELLMMPLIVRPALAELLGAARNSPEVNAWVGTMVYIPAVAGGIFGLLGGYLTDRLGRRRVLVYSIVLYGFSAFAAGFSPTVGWLLFWRCCTFVGVCVEFVAAVAWLSELFTDPKQRERVLGYTQAFGSIGGVMVSGAYYLIVTYGHLLAGGSRRARSVALHVDVWRRAGDPVDDRSSVPARVTRLGREKARRHAQATELCHAVPAGVQADDDRDDDHDGVRVRGGVWRHPADAADRPGLEEVRTLGATAQEQTVSVVSSFQEFGGLAGRVVLAYLAAVIISRRRLLHVFQVPGLILMPIVFGLVPAMGLTLGAVGRGPRGLHDRRAVQLLGQLSAAGLPDPFAWHRGKLRGQRRRADDRHIRGAARRVALHGHARAIGTHQAGVRISDRRDVRLRDRLRGQFLPAGT